MNAIMMLHRAQAGYLAAQGSGSKYIKFADPAVEAVLMAKGVSSDGIGVTVADAEAVTDIGTWFNSNTAIKFFNEFEKFKGITQLGPTNWNNRYAFYKCSALESIRLPETLKIIGTQSFDQCTSLKEVNLPIGIEQVCADAFRDTQVSGDVYLPNLTNIRKGAFAQSSFTSVSSLGSTITELEDGQYDTGIPGSYRGVFAKSLNLERVVLPSSLGKIGMGSFGGCTSLNSLSVNWNNIQIIGNGAFNSCTALEIPDLALPNLTSLGQNAFYGVKIKKISDLGKITALPTATTSTQNLGDKSVLEEVVLPDTITTIPIYCFDNYASLKRIVGLDHITSLADFTLRGTAIEELIVPNISQVMRFTALNCKSLRKVELGEVTDIGVQAFQYCASLTEFIVRASTPPTLGNAAFGGTPIASGTGYIYVPDASVDAYKAATNWAQFSDVIKPISEYTE